MIKHATVKLTHYMLKLVAK